MPSFRNDEERRKGAEDIIWKIRNELPKSLCPVMTDAERKALMESYADPFASGWNQMLRLVWSVLGEQEASIINSRPKKEES